ncbi:RCC1 domain-containing protein [Deinococcus oregonensis]|uniref:RCC1 domain-containing protein n=1 Tax=Deinococcus oregonensis TaxID=1805970 RepID=A0ABV6B4L2_9DEIO
MKRSGVLLFTGLLALTACSAVPSVPGIGSGPAALRLGMVEIEFKGGSTQPLRANLVRPVTAQALTDQPCLVLGAVISKGSVDLAGKRYLQATFPVTNNCATALKNLTYVAVRRLGADATLGGTAITAMNTFGETDAAVGLATQILPTQPVYVSGRKLTVNQNIANLQVFDDTAGGELDGLQAQVDAGRSTYDLLPYGFVATTSSGSRTIAAGETGEVTFALSVPIQPTPAEDVFSFRILMSAATNSVTSITQGLEEQDAAGKAAVETRAAALPGAEIRTLLGPALTPAAVASNSLMRCLVRTAGSRSAPTATLVNTPATLTVVAPSLPAILGGHQRQPSASLTVNGAVFRTLLEYRSLTPASLSVTDNLVHPVASSPPVRQTGTVQGTVCGLTGTATLRTSPFTSLSGNRAVSLALKEDGTVAAWGATEQANVPAGLNGVVAVASANVHSLALKADGTVVAWGDNLDGQTTVPAGLSGVVAVTAGYFHSVALKADGTVVAWGYNVDGQSDVPAGLSGVVAVAASQNHSVALKADGTVVAWGFNGQGSVPAGLSGVVAITAGQDHSVALKADGTVVAWGFNFFGQTSVPAGLSGVVAVSAGGSHSVALKADGTVVAWGYNVDGQADVPAGLSGVVAVAAGLDHSVALKADGTVVAWGCNLFNQRSVPTGLTALVP